MMNLGTQTGSLVNHIMSDGPVVQEINVGDGATILMWSDRRPATVVAIEGNRVTIQEDKSVRVDSNGMSEMQEYEFSRNPNGCKTTFRKNKRGKWEQVRFNSETGRWNKTADSPNISFGRRSKYHDFSF